MIERRKLLIALGGTMFAAPAAPLAQQPGKVRRIGFLWDVETPLSSQLGNAFRAGLHDLGYVQGKDYVIEQRSAKGDLRLFPSLAVELPECVNDFETPWFRN